MFPTAFDITFANIRDVGRKLAREWPETVAFLGKPRPDKEN
jgi:hypothetical protein